MPRPTKSRRICRHPRCLCFRPEESAGEDIVLSIDEYEALRLIDHEGLSQEQCSEQMQVGRTTVQKIYVSARSKLAAALVEGRALRIEGGDVRFCDGRNTSCRRNCPCRDDNSIEFY